jgi:hypothetical protein
MGKQVRLTVRGIVEELAADDPARVAKMIACVLANGGRDHLSAVAAELSVLAATADLDAEIIGLSLRIERVERIMEVLDVDYPTAAVILEESTRIMDERNGS